MHNLILAVLFGTSFYLTTVVFTQTIQMFITVFINVGTKTPFYAHVPARYFIFMTISWTLFYWASL